MNFENEDSNDFMDKFEKYKAMREKEQGLYEVEENTDWKYSKESVEKQMLPNFMDMHVVEYEDGYHFDFLNMVYDPEYNELRIGDVYIELNKNLKLKNKDARTVFARLNTSPYNEKMIFTKLKRYMDDIKNQNNSTIEEKIYNLVEIQRVNPTNNDLVQEIKTLLHNAGLKWTGKTYVLPRANNICKPVNNTELLKFIVNLTEIDALSQKTLDEVLTYFTMKYEPVKHCIVTRNGYYNFNDQNFFSECQKEIIIDKKSPYNFRKELIDAEPPEKLKSLLTDIFKENDEQTYNDLKEDITSLLELIGYMLDDGNRYQVLITLIGDSNSGKGLTMRLVNYLLDGQVSDVDIFKGKAIGKELNALVENDLNVIHEFKSGSKNDISFFKQVTGGDNLQLSKLYSEPQTYTHNEYAKTVLTANDVNDLIEDADKATIRRLSAFIIFKNTPDKIIDNLDEEIRDEPDAMDWLLTNSIEAYANVLRLNTDLKAMHTPEETVDMLKKFNNPILNELQEAYYYDYKEWEDSNEFVKEHGVTANDIKEKFSTKYPQLNSNRKFSQIMRDAFDLNNWVSDDGRYTTKQYTIDNHTDTYIVGLFKRK